jgi:hypothetical protein
MLFAFMVFSAIFRQGRGLGYPSVVGLEGAKLQTSRLLDQSLHLQIVSEQLAS